MADLGNIRIPALIVAGTEDLLTPPKYADFMDAHLVNSELHIIEGAGHMLVSERAEEVAEWAGKPGVVGARIMLWDEVPPLSTWVGAAIIVGSGLMILFRETTVAGRSAAGDFPLQEAVGSPPEPEEP